MLICTYRAKHFANAGLGLLLLSLFAGCASLKSTSSNRLARCIALGDAAYRSLDAEHVSTYNTAIESIVRQIDGATPEQLRAQLDSTGVKLDQPPIKLSLASYHLAPPSQMPNESKRVGIPMLLEYDTTNVPLYPRDGLTIAATAVYRRVNGRGDISLVTGKNSIELKGSTYPLEVDNVAPVTAMARRGRHVARSGFRNMVEPGAMTERTGIYLTEPYDPNKTVVLFIPGLQSTPFAFVDLMKKMRTDPEISRRFQVWTFLYATGTPVLFNALELREQLEKTISAVDPEDRDFATNHIVVIGHSMGGLIAHTLVSSSGEKVWNALFVVSPQRLKGDKTTLRRLAAALHFQTNPRVVGAIFAATPHHGSNLAESWIGHFAASLIHLPSGLQSDITNVVAANPDAATPAAKAFHREPKISSVRTLSPRDPALQALATLPVEVTFHSIIGQRSAGSVETGNDGVVSYSSSHLAGATSELIVRSGHGVCENPDAQREVLRILRFELGRRTLLAGK